MQATTTPITGAATRPTPTPVKPRDSRRRFEPLRWLAWLDQTMEALFQADLRLILGMLAPMLLVIGMIIAFCQSPTYWLVGLTLAVEICFLVMVVSKVLAIMDEPDGTSES